MVADSSKINWYDSLPICKKEGTLEIDNLKIKCFLLSNDQRIFSMSGMHITAYKSARIYVDAFLKTETNINIARLFRRHVKFIKRNKNHETLYVGYPCETLKLLGHEIFNYARETRLFKGKANMLDLFMKLVATINQVGVENLIDNAMLSQP